MKQVAIVGTNGIPARYGGFETLAENLVRGLSHRYAFTVYCSGVPKDKQQDHFLGARLIHVPLAANGWQSVPYDVVTTLHAMTYADTVLMLGAGVGFVLPANLLARRHIVVNHGGLDEWTREKFSWFQSRFLYWSSRFSSRWSSVNVADNTLLKASLKRHFGADAQVVRYGGDHVQLPVGRQPDLDARHDMVGGAYHLSVARAQEDNNLHLLVEAYRRMPQHRLVIVSNWQVSAYGRELFARNGDIPNVRLLPAIYDPRELDYLRANATLYVHSHSRCGTAPSLVEAMCLGLPVVCFDVPTNRETTRGESVYFGSADQLVEMVGRLQPQDIRALGERMAGIARDGYRWSTICEQYDRLLTPPGR